VVEVASLIGGSKNVSNGGVAYAVPTAVNGGSGLMTHWSQADLAGRLTELGLSLPQQTINRIEHGERPLKFEEARAIADLLGVTVASLAQHFSNETVAAAAALIQRAKIVKTRTEESIEENRDIQQRQEAWARHMIEVQEQQIRDAEQQLRDHARSEGWPTGPLKAPPHNRGDANRGRGPSGLGYAEDPPGTLGADSGLPR
jgi:transcriptional regulator with XRE-family HTH domain